METLLEVNKIECRYEQRKDKSAQERKGSRALLYYALIAALFVSTVSARRFLQVIPADAGQVAVSISAGGQPRDIDTERIRKMIEQKRLSEKEAEFYKKVE